MQESTKSRLTVFSRLWAIPMVLCVLLCVAAVIAGMNGRTHWMGLSVLGTVLMVIILLAQLVAAVVIRRWWCLAGGVFGVAVSVFVILSSIVAMAAGQYPSPLAHDSNEVDSLVTLSDDTVSFSLADEQMSCNIVALEPYTEVGQAVGEWLSKHLGNKYTGDMTDMRALVGFYGRNLVDSLHGIYAEGVPDYAELSYDAYMENVFETDKVVTYSLTITIDFGGAHPSTQEWGATFCKDDGSLLTWDIVRSDCQPRLQDLLREMLKGYFNVKNDSELMEYLQGVEDLANIPLPVNPPYMTVEGFTLIYQQYEIAAYAMGMPGDVIAYDRLEPWLTERAKGLIPEDYSFPVDFQGKSPSISDFLMAIANMEDPGELLIYMKEQWKEYRQGHPYKGQYTVDVSHGYLRYDHEVLNDGKRTGTTEFCCWTCDDGRHCLVAMASNFYDEGVAIDNQFSGISFFLYNKETRRMMMLPSHYFFVREPAINSLLTYTLPVTGKDIIATANDPEKGECKFVYVWNGQRFNLGEE